MPKRDGVPPQPPSDGEEIDRSDPTFDLWRTPRPDLQAGREPGLIHLDRYPLGLGASGIPTFLGRPVALTSADLRAAEVDIAILGAGLDMSGGMRGAAYGPRALRAHDIYLPNVASGLPHAHTMVDGMES